MPKRRAKATIKALLFECVLRLSLREFTRHNGVRLV